jgi:TolA-binding protein
VRNYAREFDRAFDAAKEHADRSEEIVQELYDSAERRIDELQSQLDEANDRIEELEKELANAGS